MMLARGKTPLLSLLLALSFASGQSRPGLVEETDSRLPPVNGAWGFHAAQAPDPRLPRVLLIGDSILGAYHDTVIAGLKGKANVDYWTTGLHERSPELPGLLEASVAHAPYAVIHFNIGLHGFSQDRVSDDQYEPAIRKYVEIIRAHAPQAKLIWASITPVTVKGTPSVLDPAVNPAIVKRNAQAARIMEENHILVNDLNGLMADKLALGRGDQFHWTAPAVKIQGEAVTAIVLKCLPQVTAPR